MEISYQLTRDDYRQGFKAFRRRKAYSRWLYGIAYVFFFPILASALLLSIAGHDKSFKNLFPIWFITAVSAWYLWYCPHSVANKMIKGSPGATLLQTVDVSENGFYSRSSGGEGRLSWDLIVGWAEVERVFALFPSPITFLPIPKRAMTDDQQSEFRAILQAKISRRNSRRIH